MGGRRYSAAARRAERRYQAVSARGHAAARIPGQHRGREHRRSPPRDGIRTAARNEAMNVLLVTIDQQRADTVGAYGSRLATTPNLDRLSATGVRFDAFRTQNPYCQPSLLNILTVLSL